MFFLCVVCSGELALFIGSLQPLFGLQLNFLFRDGTALPLAMAPGCSELRAGRNRDRHCADCGDAAAGVVALALSLLALSLSLSLSLCFFLAAAMGRE